MLIEFVTRLVRLIAVLAVQVHVLSVHKLIMIEQVLYVTILACAYGTHINHWCVNVLDMKQILAISWIGVRTRLARVQVGKEAG